MDMSRFGLNAALVANIVVPPDIFENILKIHIGDNIANSGLNCNTGHCIRTELLDAVKIYIEKNGYTKINSFLDLDYWGNLHNSIENYSYYFTVEGYDNIFKQILKLTNNYLSIQRNLREERERIREEAQKQKKDQEELIKQQLEEFVKPEIEKFVSQFINENNYPEAFTLKENAVKALALILKENKDVELPLDLLNELVKNVIEYQNLSVFENLFYKSNPEIINNENLTAWIKAYINTFENNFNYIFLFNDLLKKRNISLYSANVTREDIEKIYRNKNKKMIEEEKDKGFIEISIKRQVEEIVTMVRDYWGIYYLEYYLNREIEESYLKKLADIYKNNMQSGQKLSMRNEITIDNIDKITGLEFEHFLCDLFSKSGYKTEVTKASGDQGADLIIEKFGERTVVQAKRYSGAVSNSAIQEVVAAIAHYNCNNAMVITNSYFTKSAMELASSNNVELWDREKLEEKLINYNLNQF